MKIVFVNRFFYPDHSATSQLLSDLVFGLARSGYEIVVLTGRQVYDQPVTSLLNYEILGGAQIYRMWTTHFGRQNLLGRTVDYFTFYFSAAWYLLTMLKSGDLVVAKTDPPLISVVVALMAKIRGADLINWIQDLFPEIAMALEVRGVRIVGPLLKSFRNWSLVMAKFNIVLGTRMAQRLLDEHIPQNKIRLIHNWADGDEIRPLESGAIPLRLEWGLRDKFVVGYSGNMGRAHEFETILSTAEVLSQVENVVFLFIGNGARQAWIMREVDKRGLNNVVFRPYQPREQLKFSLGVPDVHLISLHPYLEGLIVPSKFYGVAAAGRPMIFIGDTDGEIPRLLKDSESGWTVLAGDVASLEIYIRDLAKCPAKAWQAGFRARQLFDKRYSKALALAQWDEVLGQVAR
ncbi:MAG: Glycosyltransferase [Nitrospira sp.]|jgi:glycosyltransferase involved in cell wall biosynthesis|nr:MAG: Glycosyltransferase [Nitrospira sp.]